MAAFLLGLGLGSYLAGRSLEGRKNLIAIFSMLEAGAGFFCLIALFVVDQLPSWLTGFSSLGFTLKFLIAFVVFLPHLCLWVQAFQFSANIILSNLVENLLPF